MPAIRRFALLLALVAALVSFAPPRPSAAAHPISPAAAATAPALLPPPVSAGCRVYPIGLSQAALDGAPGSPAPVPLPDPNADAATIRAQYPASVFTVTNGLGDTSFWFGTWTSDSSVSTLRLALAGGGTLGNGFAEFLPPSNGLLERGDYVLMTSSSLSSQDELVALRDNRVPMVVPVYDRLYGNGAQGAMHVARFAVVRLIAWKLTGASRSLTFALVGDDADYACFRHQQRATVGQTVTFTPTMPLTGGLAPGWRFGDGAASHALTATHAYSATGTFQVTLTVTNAWGVAASAQSRIVVDPALRVDFTPPEARFGQATAFHGAVGWGPPPAGVVTGTWDFGDGALAAGYNVTHTYASVGTYPVTFSATDRNGFTVSVRKPVTVAGERVWLPQAGRRSALTPPAPNPRRR